MFQFHLLFGCVCILKKNKYLGNPTAFQQHAMDRLHIFGAKATLTLLERNKKKSEDKNIDCNFNGCSTMTERYRIMLPSCEIVENINFHFSMTPLSSKIMSISLLQRGHATTCQTSRIPTPPSVNHLRMTTTRVRIPLPNSLQHLAYCFHLSFCHRASPKPTLCMWEILIPLHELFLRSAQLTLLQFQDPLHTLLHIQNALNSFSPSKPY